jgi:xylulokinase
MVAPPPCILTLDLGTSTCKASLFTLSGELRAQARVEYETRYPATGWAEQDPDAWWNAVAAGTRQLPADLRRAGAAVGLSSHRGGIVPVDARGRPLAPCIIWMDRRSVAETDAVVRTFGRERIHDITGLVPDTEPSASKLLWLRTHAPDVFRAARWYLQPRDYLYARLTGFPATDRTLASRTMLFDVRRGEWWDEGCAFVGVSPDVFPPLFPSAAAPHRVTQEAADALDLPSDIPVALGAGDRPCEVLGSGAGNGWVMVSTGTTTNVSMPIRGRPQVIDARVICSAHAVDGMVVLEQGMATSGAVLKWVRDQLLGGRQEFERLDTLAADVPPGADGLQFLPFMMGARATRWNPDARGVWFGLREAHGTGALVRSVLEGVAFELRACLELLAGMDVRVEGILAVGGGARSVVWNQIFADVTGREVRVPRQTDAASLGAMLLAARAVGEMVDVEAAARRVNPVTRHFTPDPGAVRAYQNLYSRYNDLYDTLRPVFAERPRSIGEGRP